MTKTYIKLQLTFIMPEQIDTALGNHANT